MALSALLLGWVDEGPKAWSGRQASDAPATVSISIYALNPDFLFPAARVAVFVEDAFGMEVQPRHQMGTKWSKGRGPADDGCPWSIPRHRGPWRQARASPRPRSLLTPVRSAA